MKRLFYAAEQIEAVCPDGDGLQEVVGDKGYHSNQSLVDLEAVGVRGYIAEPDRGRRNWTKNLRGHTNIRKRLLIHTAGFNLGVLMRKLIGVGTPRGLQGRLIAIMTALLPLLHAVWKLLTGRERSVRHVHELNAMPAPNPPPSP